MSTTNRQEKRTQMTKAKLLATARKLFVLQGFTNVSAEELVREASLTRGALYHHFGSKEDLFMALYTEIQREVTVRIETAVKQASSPWLALQAGCHEFLRACVEPEVQQIILLDAPIVLSWEQRRTINVQYCFGVLEEKLRVVLDSEKVEPICIAATIHLLIGAMSEAALWIAQSEDTEVTLKQARQAFDQLLSGIQFRPME
jgi:AcrR family transcriptional regulator